MTLKKFCEEKGIDASRAIDLVVVNSGGILPQKVGMQGFFVEVTDTTLVFYNDKLGVKKEIPFDGFEYAEFGIGSGNLWLQCRVNGKPLIFCTTRKKWKSDAAKLLMEKIGEKTELIDMKEYNGYTGKLFFIYMFK